MTDPQKKTEREIMEERAAEFFKPDTPERRAARKSFGTRCGHLKRKLFAKERLEGKMLEFALSIADDKIGKKLKAGEPLDDYETHLMVDVFMLHIRLSM